jgi:hypothetical protein
MGWMGSGDMKSQIGPRFDSKAEARNDIAYRVLEPKPRRRVRKPYADTFRFGRKGA